MVVRKVSTKISRKSRMLLWLKNFCHTTTVHGLRNIYNSKGYIKILLSFALITVGALVIYQIYPFIMKYYSYGVKTTITYSNDKNFDKLNMPAITMCNMNLFRRSVLSSYLDVFPILGSLIGGSDAVLAEKNTRTCQPSPNETENKIRLAGSFEDWLMQYEFDGLMNMIGMTSDISLERCYFQGRPLNCTKIAYNHVTDAGYCFTINVQENQYENFEKLMGSTSGNTEEKNAILTATFAGPRNGLQLLINVNQAEHCGLFAFESVSVLRGTGFKTFFHSPTDGLPFFRKSHVNFMPGRSYSVALKQRLYKRETEHLGLCNKTYNAEFDLNAESRYFYSICKLSCFAKFVIRVCGCVPLFFGNKIDALIRMYGTSTAEKLGHCGLNRFMCVGDMTTIFSQNYVSSFCPYCLPQCEDTEYDYTISESLFPPKSLAESKTFENERKNYLFINVYFESADLEIINEKQDLTTVDVLNFIGGSCGILLGMSLLTPFEIVFETILLMHHFALNFFRNVVIFLRNFQASKTAVKDIKKKTKIRRNVERSSMH